MRTVIERSGISIVPESKQDEAYIEDTLGLKEKGSWVKCVRIAPMGLDHAIAYLEIVPDPIKKGGWETEEA